ncbi:MAG: hypothetical protein PHF17_01625 [Arcobacteraceae bacterium]|nr:hypothetical protein [Arcobacteraceae bacterium]
MITKEFRFVSIVRITDEAKYKYPNYAINGFTPKSLAKRLISGNSEKGTKENFGFEYKTIQTKPLKKLYVVQEVGESIKNLTVTLDKQIAEDYLLLYPLPNTTIILNELDISCMEVYRG